MRASDQKNSQFKNYHDQQIYDTKHDEITVWAYSKFKDAEFLKSIAKIKPERIENLKVFIEHPVAVKNGHTLGFIDVYAEFRSCYGVYYYSRSSPPYNNESLSESEFNELPDDKKPHYKKIENTSHSRLAIEVKTNVNIGETIRQINYLKDAANASKWFVVAPLFQGFDILEEQGIRFIPYEP